MTKHKLVLLAVACTWALGASAQWQWVDKDGRKVFSDRPPPAETPQANILQQPRGTSRTPAPAAPAAAAAQDGGAAVSQPAGAPSGQAAAPAPRPAGKDEALEKKKAEAEAAEAARKKAEAERVAKARADNCARARQAKATLNSGQLLSHTNAQGERGFMDDATRAAETQRADSVIASDCGPAAAR
ncbi:DUF4124 domain-containing protein [Acidovorax sp. FG27]|uniref:DUF4124 domain-containing protein n=1 Tax=Acidovorax sp. FG27 TaxID=3133652 RepID=UPI00334034B7